MADTPNQVPANPPRDALPPLDAETRETIAKAVHDWQTDCPELWPESAEDTREPYRECADRVYALLAPVIRRRYQQRLDHLRSAMEHEARERQAAAAARHDAEIREARLLSALSQSGIRSFEDAADEWYVIAEPGPVECDNLEAALGCYGQMHANDARRETLNAQEPVRAFARWVLNQSWRYGAFEGAQDEAERLGLVAPVSVTAACGDGCNCAQCDNIPGRCYRFTALLDPASGTPAGSPT